MNKMILIYLQEKAGLEKAVETLQTNLEKVTRESQTNLDNQLRVISFIAFIQNIQNTNDFTPLQEKEKIHQKHLALQKEYSILKKRAEEMGRVRISKFCMILSKSFVNFIYMSFQDLFDAIAKLHQKKRSLD